MSHVLIWFFLGAALLLAELFTPAFVIVFFGIGAWASALVATFWPGLTQELAAFLIVSLASLLLLRKQLVSTFQGRSKDAKNGPDFPHTGRQAQVTKAIGKGGEGEIALGGSFWRATAEDDLPVESQVRVLRPDPDDELLLVVEAWRVEPVE